MRKRSKYELRSNRISQLDLAIEDFKRCYPNRYILKAMVDGEGKVEKIELRFSDIDGYSIDRSDVKEADSLCWFNIFESMRWDLEYLLASKTYPSPPEQKLDFEQTMKKFTETMDAIAKAGAELSKTMRECTVFLAAEMERRKTLDKMESETARILHCLKQG